MSKQLAKTEWPVIQMDSAAMVQVIERAASNPQVDVDKMERLLAMHERMTQTQAVAAFNASFAEMQAQMPVITERGEIKVGTQVRSTYALYEDINDAVKPVLQEHGFAINFRLATEGNKASVTGVLMHRAGHSIETSMTLDADTSGSKQGVQALASSVSYAKRYILCALLNITTRGEDDDAQRATVERITEEQAANLNALVDECPVGTRRRLLEAYKVERIADLPATVYATILKRLEKTRAEGSK